MTEKKIDTSGLENIAKQISSLTNKLEGELKPLMEFNSLEKNIEKLKNAVYTNKEHTNSATTEEGEVCMHGNSWHSGCSECDEMNLVDDLFKLVKDTPNDAELGAKVREFYNSYTNTSDKTEE